MSLYKLGALPAQFPGVLHDFTYYAAGALPKAPTTLAVPAFPDWGMLGNDRYGDCGVAGFQHGAEAAAVITGEKFDWPTEQQAVQYYLTYTGGQDSGVVLSQYLAHVRANTYYGQKVAAFAPVGVHDVPTLQTAIFLYGFSYTGITVSSAMQTASQAGQPWTTAQLGPIEGGHCVPAVGYDDQYLYVITWGMVQAITWNMWHQISTEAWAVLTGELEAHKGNGRGVNIDALVADNNRLAA